MVFGDSISDVELNPNKLVTHYNKLEALAKGTDIFPVTVELDLVDYCNHHCSWCVDPSHKTNSLEESFVLKLLDELKSLGIEGIVFKGGGEPTLHKSFSDVLMETKKRNFELGVVTNGSRLLYLYEPITRNASYLRVSIDGPNHEQHQKIHQSNDFENVCSGLSETVKLRKKLGQRHPIIGASFAMDHTMIDHVGEAIKLGDSLGVDYVLLRPPFFEEVGRRNTMTTDQKKELLAIFEKEKAEYNGRMKIFIDYWISDSEAAYFSSTGSSPRRGKFMQAGANGIEHITQRCLASPLLAVIAADKKVYPCCNLRFIEEWNIGTIDYASGETFEKVWRSERRKQVLDRIHQVQCVRLCTHPMSNYNEVIEYLKTPQYHRGFV